MGGLAPALRDGRRVALYLTTTLLFGLAYYALAQAGSIVQFRGGVEAVWWPTGLAAGFLYMAGLRYWPGAVLADFWLGFPESNPINYVQTLGNAGEMVIAAVVAGRLLGGRSALSRSEDVVRLLLAVGIGTAFSASVGTTTMLLSHDIAGGEAAGIWRTWWLADTGGGLLIMPLIMTWWRLEPLVRPRSIRTLEGLALTGFLLGCSLVGFSSGHPLTYLVFPSLIWAALRFGLPGATAANAATAVTAVGLTAHQRGPFAVSSIDDAVLGVQLFVLVAAVTTLTLGAVVSARRRAAWELAQSERREAEQATLARQRIARDLHDSVSQTLFGLTLQAGVAEHQLSAGRPGPTLELVQEMSRLAHGALAELRALIFELRPEALAEEGLVAALTKHGAAMAVQRDVAITVTGPGRRLTLPAMTEEHLYRLVLEAMGNAASHAHPSRINVTVAEADGRICIRVADDGRGFDPSEDYIGHLGLRTMRGRAAEIGGTLAIESGPGFGSTVSVSVPMRPDVGVQGSGR